MGNRKSIVLVVDDARSAENVGSMLRTADGLGIVRVYLCGITPYPAHKNDARLPHLAASVNKKISKTALGAEKSVNWTYLPAVTDALGELKNQGYQLIALEQTARSIDITDLMTEDKIALIVGNEISGVSSGALAEAKRHVNIPMQGKKESFNVSTAAAMALFYLRSISK